MSNPFNIHSDRLANNAFTPGIFRKSNPRLPLRSRLNSSNELILSTKEWSIEHISALKPAHFEENENISELIDPKFEEEAHAAIEAFWKTNHLIVPSPDVPLTTKKYSISEESLFHQHDWSNEHHVSDLNNLNEQDENTIEDSEIRIDTQNDTPEIEYENDDVVYSYDFPNPIDDLMEMALPMDDIVFAELDGLRKCSNKEEFPFNSELSPIKSHDGRTCLFSNQSSPFN